MRKYSKWSKEFCFNCSVKLNALNSRCLQKMLSRGNDRRLCSPVGWSQPLSIFADLYNFCMEIKASHSCLQKVCCDAAWLKQQQPSDGHRYGRSWRCNGSDLTVSLPADCFSWIGSSLLLRRSYSTQSSRLHSMRIQPFTEWTMLNWSIRYEEIFNNLSFRWVLILELRNYNVPFLFCLFSGSKEFLLNVFSRTFSVNANSSCRSCSFASKVSLWDYLVHILSLCVLERLNNSMGIRLHPIIIVCCSILPWGWLLNRGRVTRDSSIVKGRFKIKCYFFIKVPSRFFSREEI